MPTTRKTTPKADDTRVEPKPDKDGLVLVTDTALPGWRYPVHRAVVEANPERYTLVEGPVRDRNGYVLAPALDDTQTPDSPPASDGAADQAADTTTA